jgi:hypothetical protein
MPGIHDDDERAAWALAEQFLDKGRSLMRTAESALDEFLAGKELNRLRCSRRGISATDAEIRYSTTTVAQKSLSDNSFNVTQAMMYYAAAAAHYSRAAYLRSRL